MGIHHRISKSRNSDGPDGQHDLRFDVNQIWRVHKLRNAETGGGERVIWFLRPMLQL